MIRVGVIGYGYWGPNLVRNFSEAPGTRVAWVSDLRPNRLAEVKNRYPDTQITTDYQEILTDPAVDAVAIATPVSTHYALALQALRAGKHVLVEKPLASSSEQCVRLLDEAARRHRLLMVDHTFLYTGAVKKIRQLVESDSLGEILYYDSVRINLGLFQHDVNVLWDLAVHDLAILDFVLGAQPCAVSATGISHVPKKPENIAYITLFFPGSLIAHIHVNWLAPLKVRRTLIGGSRKMIVYDELENDEKIKVYDKGITVCDTPDSLYQVLVSYRTGDMWAPQLERGEALQEEIRKFTGLIEEGKCPLDDAERGLRVVRILEAAGRSIQQRGIAVDLPRECRAAA